MYALLPIHSMIRWLVLIVGLVAVVKFAVGWLRAGEFKGMDRGLTAGFSGMMDLQALLGLVLLFGFGFSGEGFPAIRIAHGALMLIAVILGHLPARWRGASGSLRFRNGMLCILGALVCIYAGVAILPVGWSM